VTHNKVACRTITVPQAATGTSQHPRALDKSSRGTGVPARPPLQSIAQRYRALRSNRHNKLRRRHRATPGGTRQPSAATVRICESRGGYAPCTR